MLEVQEMSERWRKNSTPSIPGILRSSQFLAVRKAFDPDGLLNPDKAVPTLARCAEFNAMHVHHGQLPHPELERF